MTKSTFHYAARFGASASIIALLMGGTGRFINVFNASALMAASPETVFSGAVILVSRAAVEMVAPQPKGKA